MKKERLIELYKILLEFCIAYDRPMDCIFICNRIDQIRKEGLLASKVDCSYLKNHFEKNKPRIDGLHESFALHPTYLGGGFWWKLGREADDQRLEFLSYLIEKLECGTISHKC